ncbi:MAG: hypothetical protein JXR69_05035 [Candidatus Delongbacteria bacterium]|nr:hypothetical protein [Candidatus Delongbacteria bacterium]
MSGAKKIRYICFACGSVIFADELKPGEEWTDVTDLLCEECEFEIENLPVDIDEVDDDDPIEEEEEDDDDDNEFY